MKFINRLKSIFNAIKLSFKRFPITIGISTILTISLIYFIENVQNMPLLRQEELVRINMILGMGILLSLSIDLLKENFFDNEKQKIILSYFAGLAILVLYHNFLLKDLNFASVTRYIGVMIFLLLAFFYIPVIGNKDKNYEYRVIDIFGNFFETAIYSLVLLFGIFAILLTVDSLFDIDIDFEYYYYIFLIIFFIFAVSFFLSKLPKDGETFESKQFSQSMKILLTYIVIPLISIYTIILYVYFAKILITWEWPKGLVSHLVVWYTAISIGVVFLITPLIESDKISRSFKFLFPKLVLPILLMMFISIGQRINQYGITENRYYILVLGSWITLIMIYFSIKKPLKNIIIPISLSLIVLNSVLGPLSSYSISKYSQNNRLEDILNSNSMISGDNIVRNPDISEEDQRQINNIVHYFDNNHSLEDIKILPDDFDTNEMLQVFGFRYDPNIWDTPSRERYFYYGIDIVGEPIDIGNYDYYIQVSPWLSEAITFEDLAIKDTQSNLTIEKNNEEIMKLKTQDIAIEVLTKFGPNLVDENYQTRPDEMTYEIKNDNMEIKIIFTHISGVESDQKIEVNNIEYIMLINDINN